MSLIFKKLVNQIVIVLITFIPFSVPVVINDAFSSPFEFPKQIILVSLLGLILIFFTFSYWQRKVILEITKFDLTVILFVLITGIVSLSSHSPIKSIIGSYGNPTPTFFWSLIMALWYGVIRWYFIKFNNLEFLFRSFLISSLLSFAFILRQAFSDKSLELSWFLPKLIYGNQQSSSHLGIYLVLLILVGIIYFTSYKKSFWSILIVFLSSLFLILTLSRNAWLGLILGLGILLYLRRVNLDSLKRFFLTNKIIIPLITIILILISIFVIARFQSWFKLDDANNSFFIRLYELKSAGRIFFESPLTGYGPDLAVNYLRKYRWEALSTHEIEAGFFSASVHNLYLELLASGGLLQFGVFATLVLFSILTIKKNLLIVRNSPELSGIAAIFSSLLFMFFSYNYTTISSLFFWLCLGVLASLNTPLKKLISPGRIFFLTTFVLGVILIYSITKAALGNIYYTLGIRSTSAFNSKQTNLNYTQAKYYINKAIELDPWNDLYYKTLGRLALMDVVSNLNKFSGSPESLNNYVEAKQMLEQAYLYNPTDPQLNELLSEVIFIQAKFDKDLQKYRQALYFGNRVVELAPTFPSGWNSLGLIELDQGWLEVAEKHFREAIRLRFNHHQAHYHLGEALKQQGRFEEAIKAYEEVFKFAPNDPMAKIEIEKVQELQKKIFIEKE